MCVTFLFLLLQPSVKAAENLISFLKIESIKGDSNQKGHSGEIEALGFATGVDLPSPAPGGGTEAKPEFFEVIVTKNIDKASPLLFISCATGKLLPNATLTMARVTPTSSVDFFKIILTNVVISRVETKGLSGTKGALSEEVALRFTKVQWSITTFNAEGKPTIITRGYDLANGKVF